MRIATTAKTTGQNRVPPDAARGWPTMPLHVNEGSQLTWLHLRAIYYVCSNALVFRHCMSDTTGFAGTADKAQYAVVEIPNHPT